MNIKISEIKKIVLFHKSSIIFLGIIFLIFFIPRLISLGSDISNYDGDFWYERLENFSTNFINGRYAETHQKYHPGVTLMWLSGTTNYIFKAVFENTFHYDPTFVPHQFPKINAVTIFPLVFVISILGALNAWIISKLLNKQTAIVFSILLSIEPFFLGITKFLHLTGLNSMLMFTSFLLILYYYLSINRNRLFFYISSMVLGFSMLTKIDAGIVLITNMILISFFERKSFSNFIKQNFIYGFLCLAVFLLFYPAMWTAPLTTFTDIIKKGILDNALEESGDAGIFENVIYSRYFFYPFMIFLRSSGFMFIAILFAGLTAAYKLFTRKLKTNSLILWTSIYFVINFALLTIPGKMIDRYLVNFYPPLILIASYFLINLIKGFEKKYKIILCVLLGLYYGILLTAYYPVYSFFHTDLTGGIKFLEQINLPVKNRGEYYAQGAFYINEKIEKSEDKKVLVAHAERSKTFGNFFVGDTVNVYNIGEIDLPKIDYYIFEQEKFKAANLKSKCEITKELGPQNPFAYNAIIIAQCKDITFRELE